MAANKELKDFQIARIGGRISSKGLKMVATTYRMKIEHAQLDNITTSAHGNEEQVVRDILQRWRNSTGATVQVTVQYFLFNYKICNEKCFKMPNQLHCA